jgi:hypothetical protein
METSGDKKKSTWICLDINPLFSHTDPKPVQALVITYDEVSQALAVEADVMLPNPFLDLGLDGVVRWNWAPSEFHVFGELKRHLRSRRFPSHDTAETEVQE